MPQEEQSEWPSFEAVLRDVAPSDVAQRTQAAITTSRRALSGDDITVSTADHPAVLDSPRADAPPVARPLADLKLDLLPAPLAPLELDTSAVRALLEPRPGHIDEELSLDALAPLEHPTEVVPRDVETFEVEAPENDALESVELDAEADDIRSPEEPHVESAPFESSPFESAAFESSPFASDLESAPFESAAFESSPFASDLESALFETPAVESSPFTSDSADEALADVPGIELPDQQATHVEVFEDLQFSEDLVFDHDLEPEAPVVEVEHEAGTVFELGEAELSAAEALDDAEADAEIAKSSVDFFSDPSIDLFDLNISSDEIETDRIDLHGLDLYTDASTWPGHGEVAITDETDPFDSIATADEIEGALSELSELGDVEEPAVDLLELDNVIPIRPAQNPIDMPDSFDPPDPFESFESSPENKQSDEKEPPKHSAWVSLDPALVEPEPEAEIDDPWAHMRPDEEPKAKTLWSRIPKFFGGEERHNARKAREASEPVTDGEPHVDITFDSTCPNCGGECQVDLDDPIGRRVHVSCPSCDHMWFTPYTIDGESSSGAQTG